MCIHRQKIVFYGGMEEGRARERERPVTHFGSSLECSRPEPQYLTRGREGLQPSTQGERARERERERHVDPCR